MQKVFRITFLVVLISAVLFVPAKAQGSATGIFAGSPKNISLTQTIDSLNINFDVAELPVDADIATVNLVFEQRNDLSSDSTLKILNPITENILGAVSTVNSGNKEVHGLEGVFENLRGEGDSISLKFLADGLESSEVLQLENIALEIEYKIIDNKAPKIQDIEITEITDNSAIITWTTDEDSSCVVRFGKTSNYTEIAESNTEDDVEYAKEHSALLLNLSPGITYHFQIVAEDEAGNVRESKDNNFLTQIEIGDMRVLGESSESGLSKVTGLSGQLFYEEGTYEFQISWSASEDFDVDGYYIYRKAGEDGFEKIAEFDSSKVEFTDDDLVEWLDYIYVVRSYRGISISPQSEELRVLISQDNVSMALSNNNYIDLQRLLLFVAVITAALLIIGYFSAKRMKRFYKNVFSMEKRKNLFRDPDFMKENDG
jgi:hypothetical protein